MNSIKMLVPLRASSGLSLRLLNEPLSSLSLLGLGSRCGYSINKSLLVQRPPCTHQMVASRSLATQYQSQRDLRKQWMAAQEEDQEEEPKGDTPYPVYEGALTSQMKRIKIFSITTSVGGLAMQPIIIQKTTEQGVGVAATATIFTMVGFFTFVTPFLIHQMAKKYVTEIRFDPKTHLYTAVTYTFFLQKQEVTFSKEDVVVPDVPGPFTSVLVRKDGKEVPLFFALESFIYLRHYGLLMGYDKPLDLHITPEALQAALSKKAELTNPSKKMP